MSETNLDSGLAATIRRLRDELALSSKMLEASGNAPLFRLGAVEVKVQFTIKETASDEGGIDLKLFALKSGDVVAHEHVHTLTLQLSPLESAPFGVLHNKDNRNG